ncbi:hypothetical protein AAG906_010449 [Vitis piasezkii]
MVALTGTKLGWLPKVFIKPMALIFETFGPSHFALRDLRDISYFLGIEVTRLSHALHLNQQCYIHQLLEHANLHGAKSISHEPLSALDATHYSSLVGALQYITLTRPEISFAVNRACQYMAHPTTSHLQAAKRILRYLKGTATHGISIHASPSLSTSGFCLFFGTNLISWSSTKQRVVSRSSVKSEYRALAFLTTELTHLPCRSKHIEIDLHFVRDKVLHKELLIQYVPSTDQLLDVFTKHVPSRFSATRTHLSVVPRHINLGMIDKHPCRWLILLLSNKCCYL